MKTLRNVAVIVGVVSIIGTALPAWSFVTPQNQIQADDAAVVPTQQEVQRQLSAVGEEVRQARLASISVPEAESDYLAAQRAYEFGQYEDAMDAATAAENAIPVTPNWFHQANLAAK